MNRKVVSGIGIALIVAAIVAAVFTTFQQGVVPDSNAMQRFLSRVRVDSTGSSAVEPGHAVIHIDEALIVRAEAVEPGIHMVGVRGSDIVLRQSFDTGSSAEAADLFTKVVERLSNGTYVVLAVSGDATGNFSDGAQAAIRSLGAFDGLGGTPSGCSYLLVGAKGLKPGEALEVWSEHDTVNYPNKHGFYFPSSTIVHLRMTLRMHTGAIKISSVAYDGIVASHGSDRTIKLWSTMDGRLLRTLRHDGQEPFDEVALSADGKMVAGWPNNSATIYIWRSDTGKIARKISTKPELVRSIAFSPDSQMLAVVTRSGKVTLYRVGSGQEVLTIDYPYDCSCLAFSPDGNLLALGGSRQQLSIYDTETGQERWSKRADSRGVLSVEFTPDGQKVVTTGKDHTIKIWTVENGHTINVIRGEPSFVFCQAITPDGRTIACSSDDFKIRLYKLPSGRPLGGPFAAHFGFVTRLEFTPDGKTLVSSSNDGTIKLWDLVLR